MIDWAPAQLFYFLQILVSKDITFLRVTSHLLQILLDFLKILFDFLQILVDFLQILVDLLQIIDGLSSELNRLYQIFVEKNPYFEVNNGQVSICVHSLGSVILYDILTGWDPIELYDQYVFNVLVSSIDLWFICVHMLHLFYNFHSFIVRKT